MGPGSYGRQASKEDLKAFDEFAAYSRVDPRAKAELVGKLCEAATRGDCAELRELIAEGADVTTGDYDNRTALHLAAAEGHLDAVGFRVEIKFTAPSS